MLTPRTALILFSALLSACGSAGPDVRYAPPPAQDGARIGIAYGTVAVREVSLPTYAGLEDIMVDRGAGRIEIADGGLWADDPARAVTLGLAGAIRGLTRATVAPDPWPFQSDPEVSVDVRFESLVASAAGTFEARGQYFVAPADPDRRGHSHAFALAEPYDPAQGSAGIAAARERAVAALARVIVRDGLR